MVKNCLSTLRKSRGFGATELARAASISRQAIHAMESGEFVPNTAVALRLASVLGVAVEELFSLDRPIPKAPRQVKAENFPGTTIGGKKPYASRLVKLCQVGRRTLAIPAEPAAFHLPESDGMLLPPSAGAGVAVEPWEDWKPGRQLLIAGCDPAVTVLRKGLDAAAIDLIPWNCNSSQSLQLLKHGLAHIAGCHLWDETGGQNLRTVKSIFRSAAVSVVTFAVWEQGIVVARANPLGIREVADLARPKLTVRNREPGSGSRALLDCLLQRAGVPVARVGGYDSQADGHLAAARAVALGHADCCIATRAAARAFALGFIPLVSERYDFVIPNKFIREPGVEACLDLLNRASLRRALGAFAGYEVGSTGKVI